MLATLSTSVCMLFWVYLCITAVFFLLMRANSFVFARIWLVFAFFFAQLLLLAFFGEDFFVAFALAAELPVFFGFFFFYVAKANIQGLTAAPKSLTSIRWVYVLVCIAFSLAIAKKVITHPAFDYYAISFQNPARSDFFLFYFTYYVTAPQLIGFVGALISVVTVVLVMLAFKNQVASLANLQKSANLSWTRTQSGFVQTAQKSSSVFFRL